MQRFAIACVVCRAADVYMFDEASSFLDVRQRMTATEVIRDLCFDDEAEAAGKPNAAKYVVVVEHDLAVLDCTPLAHPTTRTVPHVPTSLP